MDIALIAASILIVVSTVGISWYLFIFNKRFQHKSSLRTLMSSGGTTQEGFIHKNQKARDTSLDPTNDISNGDDLKKKTDKIRKKSKKRSVTIEEKFYHAGMFSTEDRVKFKKKRIFFAIVMPLLFVMGGVYYKLDYPMLVLVLAMGGMLGFQIPFSILDRKIAARSEDIMFFLPLVVEQISIGVSSSLDIGPCLDKVVSMAEERDSHNVVTELVKQVHFYVKSGVSLTEALIEIGRMSGHTELKHVFSSLSQVAKHGGEITRQLQELADAVTAQRETRIEEKIKKLELEATGPVALVFVAFMAVLLIGFGLQITGAF